MNYKEMLDKFDYIESKLAFLELENRYLKERVTKLEGYRPTIKLTNPQFTPGTFPQQPSWPNTWTLTANPQDAFQ